MKKVFLSFFTVFLLVPVLFAAGESSLFFCLIPHQKCYPYIPGVFDAARCQKDIKAMGQNTTGKCYADLSQCTAACLPSAPSTQQFLWYCQKKDYQCIKTSQNYFSYKACLQNLARYLPRLTSGQCYGTKTECEGVCLNRNKKSEKIFWCPIDMIHPYYAYPTYNRCYGRYKDEIGNDIVEVPNESLTDYWALEEWLKEGGKVYDDLEKCRKENKGICATTQEECTKILLGNNFSCGKPVLYLYPTQTTKVKVKLDFNGKLMTTYPKYDDKEGWNVLAQPDGTLTNLSDNQQYSYLFWDGYANVPIADFSTGFVIKGKDTKAFLQQTLSKLGLTPKEYNEMIVYWLPWMEHHSYNLIHFANKEYTDNAKLTITPAPDSILRIFMSFKELKEPKTLKPQTLDFSFQRQGFSAIEWGGAEQDGDWKMVR